MNYYKKTIKVEGLSKNYVFAWIAEHPDAELDHTTFQDAVEHYKYYMVSRTDDDCGVEECVTMGLEQWQETDVCGVLISPDYSGGNIVVKANNTYYMVTF